MARPDGRKPNQIRPVTITRGVSAFAAGSALIQLGQTHVLCTASIEQGLPRWREALGLGWLTAEYDMLPASTPTRRTRSRAHLDGRTQEIQRLIGRTLRAVVNLGAIGRNTIYLDCDVLQADGGTRTAAITAAYVALVEAHKAGVKRGLWTGQIVREPVAAISAGIVAGRPVLDLNYEEDSAAEVDVNVAMTASGRLVELQATAERTPFDRRQLDEILDMAGKGIQQLVRLQEALARKRTVRLL